MAHRALLDIGGMRYRGRREARTLRKGKDLRKEQKKQLTDA